MHTPTPPSSRTPSGQPPALDRATLTQVTRGTPLRLLGAVALEWLLIVGSAALSMRVDHPAFTVLAVLFIATRQHALLVLMHEFSHRQFSRTRPTLNDALGDFLTALPFFVTVHGFRRDHAAHHAHTSTDADPNWALSQGVERYTFPKSQRSMTWTLAKHVLGCYTLRDLKGFLFDSKMAVACPRATRIRQIVFGVAVVGATTWFHAWPAVAIYWLLPSLTGLMALLYLREVGEHFGMFRTELSPSRTLILNPIERWLIAPYNVHYHAEHHLHPSVPAFRLRDLHHGLQAVPAFVRQTAYTRGYKGLLRELGGLR